jgi:protocatechuate 3,4-dioxygenase beta subunit
MSDEDVSRREALRWFGSVGAMALAGACGGSVATTGTGGSGGSGAGGSTTATGTTTATSTSTGSATGWATGDGTFLTNKSYGDPFVTPGPTCVVWKDATMGPCHSNTYHRQEMSEGIVGLPTRLELLVVDASCNPIDGAIVEVWHASPDGLYSAAPTVEASDIGYDAAHGSDLNSGFCTGNAQKALSAGWFRAYQKAGADGRVTFDTVFPGWYMGRTIHIHFRVTVGGVSTKTSQLFFDDALNTEILTQHPTYAPRGQKDTPNASDNVVTQSSLVIADVAMSAAQQTDGALLAWKVITVA